MKQNKLEVKQMKSEYCVEEHLTIVVDGIPLDVLLNNFYPTNNFLGLVPTILEWIDNQQERNFVKERYTSPNQEEMLPVLMCPDDCDLWCTIIVAKVVKKDGYVAWEKLGIDRSVRDELLMGYECIGSRVEWLEKVPSMLFDEIEYYVHLNKIYS